MSPWAAAVADALEAVTERHVVEELMACSTSSGSRQVDSRAGAPTASNPTTAQLGAGNHAAARLTSASATGPGSSDAATC